MIVGSRHGEFFLIRILGIGIPYLLMKLFSCRSFLKNINSAVILKFPKRMLGYYFSKGFAILECNLNHSKKIPNKVKQNIHAEEPDISDYVMTCINRIPSTSKHRRSCCQIKVYILPKFNNNSMKKGKS